MTPESKKSLETWRSLTTFYSRGTTTRKASSSLLVSLQNARIKGRATLNHRCIEGRGCVEKEKERESG